MQFSITTRHTFCAAHALRLLDGTMEPVHGHNWKVHIVVSGPLDGMGVVMDFHDLHHRVSQIIGPMHNRHLNELPAFEAMNPSAENVALYITESLRLPAGVKLLEVVVFETDDNSATVRQELAV